jgi:hypothetical protein
VLQLARLGRNLGEEVPMDLLGRLLKPTQTSGSHLVFCEAVEVRDSGRPGCGPGSRGFESEEPCFHVNAKSTSFSD